MRITTTELEEKEFDDDEITIFKVIYPDGCDLTGATLENLRENGWDDFWIQMLISRAMPYEENCDLEDAAHESLKSEYDAITKGLKEIERKYQPFIDSAQTAYHAKYRALEKLETSNLIKGFSDWQEAQK
jgi:hypothetical protein